MTEFYKDGDHMAIKTDAGNEKVFMGEVSELLADLIDDGQFKNDWDFQLIIWLPQIVDICCKYRGCKNSVYEQRVFIAGSTILDKMDLVVTTKKEVEEI